MALVCNAINTLSYIYIYIYVTQLCYVQSIYLTYHGYCVQSILSHICMSHNYVMYSQYISHIMRVVCNQYSLIYVTQLCYVQSIYLTYHGCCVQSILSHMLHDILCPVNIFLIDHGSCMYAVKTHSCILGRFARQRPSRFTIYGQGGR